MTQLVSSNVLARKIFRNERGNALALFGLALPMLVGAVGLAVDTAHWVLLKRQLQQVADAAAMSGSFTAIQGGDIDYAVDTEASRRRGDISSLNVRAALSPEGHDGDSNAVGVTVSAPAALSFASLFLSKPLIVTASATATMVETDDFCAFALDDSSETGITIDPNSSIEIECGMATNSSGINAFLADATTKLGIKKLFAFGGIVAPSGNSASRFRAHALMQKDPGADLVMPEVPNTGCPNITINPTDGNAVTLKPGCFGNLVLNGQVNLLPGSYILNRGSLLFGPRSQVNCDGCSFFLTSADASQRPGSVGGAKIDPAATVTLAAPSTGDYAGLLMFQDRHAAPEQKGEENFVAANGRSKLDGLLYFPSQSLKVDASGAPNLSCARMVGKRLILGGHVLITKGCSVESGRIKMLGAEVRLVD